MNIVQVLVLRISKYKNYYVKNAHVQSSIPSLRIAPVHSGNRRISSARREQVLTREKLYGHTELDSHANTTVAGQNCVPIWHTERSCNVAPFSDTYEPMKDAAIVSAATVFTSTQADSIYSSFMNVCKFPNCLTR